MVERLELVEQISSADMEPDVNNDRNSEAKACSADEISTPSVAPQPSTKDRKRGKKGTPWTEEEHRMFLAGLHKLGKGDWKGIARGYVITRTPTQVASHAQKYFIRQSNISKRKRRSSLFDITSETGCIADEEMDELSMAECLLQQSSSCTEDLTSNLPRSGAVKTDSSSLSSVERAVQEEEISAASVENTLMQQALQDCFVTPPAYALLIPGWSGFTPSSPPQCTIVRPTPVLPTSPIQIDVWNGVSELNLGTFPSPPPLSLKLSEHSAFQANPCKKINQSGGEAISVV